MAWTKVVKTALDINGTTPLAVFLDASPSEGDLLYAFVTNDNGQTTSADTGWTKIQTADSGAGAQKIELWRKVAGSGETLNYGWADPGGSLTCITFIQLTGGNTATPEDVTPSTNTQASTTSPVANGVTTVTDGCMILACWNESNAANSITKDASMVGESNLLATGHPNAHAVGSLTQATLGATGAKTGSWSVANAAASILVAVRPLSGTASSGQGTSSQMMHPGKGVLSQARFFISNPRDTSWNGPETRSRQGTIPSPIHPGSGPPSWMSRQERLRDTSSNGPNTLSGQGIVANSFHPGKGTNPLARFRSTMGDTTTIPLVTIPRRPRGIAVILQAVNRQNL